MWNGLIKVLIYGQNIFISDLILGFKWKKDIQIRKTLVQNVTDGGFPIQHVVMKNTFAGLVVDLSVFFIGDTLWKALMKLCIS